MARIQGMQNVFQKLRAKAAKAKDGRKVDVTVGYSTHYAIYVHENLEAHHPIGQAKYLSTAARQYTGEMGRIIRTAFQQGKTMEQALMLGGLKLQRESQKLVPVDTGALKNSAYTKLV